MHKNPDCAAVLANHIYNQMRDMDTLSPGVTYDLSQSLALSDRRRGLPSTVTEWKAWRAEKREINLQDAENLPESLDDEAVLSQATAYDIMNPTGGNEKSMGTRFSQRLKEGGGGSSDRQVRVQTSQQQDINLA